MKNRNIVLFIESIFATAAFCFYCSFSQVSIFPVVLLLLIFVFFTKCEKKKNWIIRVLSIILNIFLIIGKYVVFMDEAGNAADLYIKISICAVGGYILFEYIISFVYSFLDKKKIKIDNSSETKIKPVYIFIFSFVFIFVCWLLILLIEYPGPISPDSLNQIDQVLKVVRYNNDNPLINTLYIKGLYTISSLFTNEINSRLFISSLIQSILHSAFYSYIICYIYKRTGKFLFVVCLNVFYGVISFNSMWNISLSKDTSFALITSCLLLFYIKLFEEKSVFNIVGFILASVLFCLGRANGLYAYLFALIVSFVIFCITKKDIKIVVVLLICFVFSVFSKYNIIKPLLSVLNKDRIIQESYSGNYKDAYSESSKLMIYMPAEIPSQLIANVVCHDRELTEKEIWLIEERCPLEIIKQSYNKYSLLPLNIEIKKHTTDAALYSIPTIEYYKLFIELFLKYPQDYIEAFCYMTRYYYYPSRSVETNYYKVFNNDLGIKNQSLIFRNSIDKIETMLSKQKEIPLVGSLFSPGVTVFLMFIVFFYGLYSKNEILSRSMLFIIGIWATVVLVTPEADEFRYIYPVVNSLPLILISPFLLNKEGGR